VVRVIRGSARAVRLPALAVVLAHRPPPEVPDSTELRVQPVPLAIRWHTPARLLRFLEDARQRDVVRTVGPVYQFRHARLQDRLARQVTPK